MLRMSKREIKIIKVQIQITKYETLSKDGDTRFGTVY